MAKKNFKDRSQSSVASMFMSKSDNDNSYIQDVQDVQCVRNVEKDSIPEMCRLNLKIQKEYKDYLEYISWANHTNMTQYLVNLITEDMAKYEQDRFKMPNK